MVTTAGCPRPTGRSTPFSSDSPRCGRAGLSHVELKASGSPHEMIEREAQTCDLIVIDRGTHFRFRVRDDESNETIKKVLKNAPRPLFITPDGAFPPGPVVVAYDGSLQAARALAAFQSTGIGEWGQVHVLTMDYNTLDAARHADRAVKYLAYHKIDAIPHVLPSSTDPAHTILEQVRQLVRACWSWALTVSRCCASSSSAPSPARC